MTNKKLSKKKAQAVKATPTEPVLPPKFVFLSTRTFVGSSTVYRPSHYWGTLADGENSHALMHKLTLLQARNHHAAEQERNKVLYDNDETTMAWEAGDEVDFFWSEKAVVAAAKRTWLKLYPDALVLLHSKATSHLLAICNPCEVLDHREVAEALAAQLKAVHLAAKQAEDAQKKASNDWVCVMKEYS